MPDPSSSTTPAKSVPSPQGKLVGKRDSNSPSLIAISPGFIPAAFTATSSSRGPGTGRSTSTTSSTSGPPYRSNLTAFIRSPSLERRAGAPPASEQRLARVPVVVHLDVNAGLEDLPDYRGQQK